MLSSNSKFLAFVIEECSLNSVPTNFSMWILDKNNFKSSLLLEQFTIARCFENISTADFAAGSVRLLCVVGIGEQIQNV